MLARVKQFITENAQRLSSQLSQLEDNVAAETADIRASFMAAPVPLSFVTSIGTARSLSIGTLANCDTTLGILTLTLARPAPADRKTGFACILKRSAANSVLAVPAGLSLSGVGTKINGANSKSYSAAGLYWLYFDGDNWYG